MTLRTIFALAPMLLLATPLQAQGGNTQAARNADPQRLICRRTHVTGQLVGERVCRTREEWDRQSRAARETGSAIENRSRIIPCSGNVGC